MCLAVPVVDVFAKAQSRHFDLSFGGDQAVTRSQVSVDEALVG